VIINQNLHETSFTFAADNHSIEAQKVSHVVATDNRKLLFFYQKILFVFVFHMFLILFCVFLASSSMQITRWHFCDDLHDTDEEKNPIIVSHLLVGIGLFDGEWLRHIDGAAISDHDVLGWLVTSVGLRAFDLSDDIHSLDDLSENDVTSVEPSCLLGGDEELRSVCVFSCGKVERRMKKGGEREKGRKSTCVGHRQPSAAVVLELEVLVFEAFAVD
jgi:hypothetical protein